MIAGPAVYICNECVDICVDVLAEIDQQPLKPAPLALPAECSLCHLPTTLDQATVIEERGVLCPGCMNAIAAGAVRRNIQIENIAPILNVRDIAASVGYYVNVLGFRKAPWGDTFTSVSRDGHGIYLCEGGQGQAGTWIWIGVEDAAALHEELVARGAKIRMPPTNFEWALEFQVEDPDGHVLRFGAEPTSGR